jgi:hypothetical protein
MDRPLLKTRTSPFRQKRIQGLAAHTLNCRRAHCARKAIPHVVRLFLKRIHMALSGTGLPVKDNN